MKFDTMLRRLFDAAFVAYQTNHDPNTVAAAIATAMEKERQKIFAELDRETTLSFSALIERKEGPLVTASVSRYTGQEPTYGHLNAAGAVRLRSNHRIIAYRGNVGGVSNVDRFSLEFLEGDSVIVDMNTENPRVMGGHRHTPPFMIGDLSETDQALQYLMSRAALGDHPDLTAIEKLCFPAKKAEHPALYGVWATDAEMIPAVLLLEAA